MYTVSVTPFAPDSSLDEAGLRRHVRRLADAGLWIYLAGSGTGEGNSLTEEEMERVFTVAVAEVEGRVPVRPAGIEHRSARDAIRHAEIAKRASVDAQGHGLHLALAMTSGRITANPAADEAACAAAERGSVA